jgi:hypothetical protein
MYNLAMGLLNILSLGVSRTSELLLGFSPGNHIKINQRIIQFSKKELIGILKQMGTLIRRYNLDD